jgi:hypothetical protein
MPSNVQPAGRDEHVVFIYSRGERIRRMNPPGDIDGKGAKKQNKKWRVKYEPFAGVEGWVSATPPLEQNMATETTVTYKEMSATSPLKQWMKDNDITVVFRWRQHLLKPADKRQSKLSFAPKK